MKSKTMDVPLLTWVHYRAFLEEGVWPDAVNKLVSRAKGMRYQSLNQEAVTRMADNSPLVSEIRICVWGVPQIATRSVA